MLNKKGMLFSIMVFILLGSLLTLHQLTLKHDGVLNESIANTNVFNRVSDKYANVKNNFTVLTTSDAEREVDQRIVPFDYDINSTKLGITTELPIRQIKIDEYLEILNSFRIFLEDESYSNEFDSMYVDINTLTPASWSGTDKNISFVIHPQCLKYSILDQNTMQLEFVCDDYNYMSIIKQEVNITLKSIHDFNSMSCNFNGSTTCFNDDFNSLETNPYLSVNIDTQNCFNCQLGQTSVRGHYNPGIKSEITLACVGSGCLTPDFDMNFMEMTRLSYTGQAVDLALTIDFNSIITSFDFNDANISVEDRFFGTRKWN